MERRAVQGNIITVNEPDLALLFFHLYLIIKPKPFPAHTLIALGDRSSVIPAQLNYLF